MNRRFDWLPLAGWDPSTDEYHANSSFWGSSMLRTFRESPAKAFAVYVDKTMAPDPPTASMRLGSLVHVALLEPDSYDLQVEVVEFGRRTNKFKAAEAAYPGKMVVTKDEHDQARSMAERVRNPSTLAGRMAKSLLSGGLPEFSFRWEDSSGVPCKVRFDYIAETSRGPAMVNLKTSVSPDPEGFKRQAFNLQYPAQQAFYRRGFMELTGAIPDSVIVVIGNKPPHEVMIGQPDPDFMEFGHRMVVSDLDRLSKALASKAGTRWSAQWESSIQQIALPAWASVE